MTENEQNELPEQIDAHTEPDGAAPPPPYGATPSHMGAIANPFVRDPHATFGGVASGVAHRYGWDVALTRLAFVVLTLATSGFGLVVYLLAWMIVPRADYWPPMQTPSAAIASEPNDISTASSVGSGSQLADENE